MSFLPVAPYLILAGDIGNINDNAQYSTFLQETCSKYRRVLLVPGNHEAYHMSRPAAQEAAVRLGDELGDRFVWMDKLRVDIHNGATIILGCTLYSHIPNKEALSCIEASGVKDFGRIGEWSWEQHNAEHATDTLWLRQQLAFISEKQPDSRVIIVTHFPPTWDMTSANSRLHGDKRYFFGSDVLDRFLYWPGAHLVTHWVFGHTHWNTTFRHGSTTFVSNHRQDQSSSRKFDPEATI
ncbi:hypothetical protein B0A50_02176 [Salinomyces thailandicus]|uniref:Calcineurin-like phosphoesterase domain-containing protein n=1 Tax=Salinomyces thailandicus TaxID=706561 RepID=A0A4U0U7T9_9PEZI|nr:hypothetical protein B0A50_02176 [Salinomyces thailandica]